MPMPGDRWLLPEGIEEVTPARAERLERARRRVLDLFAAWGYRLVMPPFVEFLDSLLTGTGSDLDLQTFKLIDQISGRLLGVRADMTPQVARIDARHLAGEAPARLCYLGTVLRALPEESAGSRSPVQLGAELFGHGGVESDCEIAWLMVETLAALGIAPIHLDVGHVGVFRALVAAAGLDGRDEERLHEALQRKAHAEIRAHLEAIACPAEPAAGLAALAGLHGGVEVLAEARSRLVPCAPAVAEPLATLEALVAALAARAPQARLHLDLAELRGYRYHTGVVFAAFTPGHGREIARGGRYDEVGMVFGRARPATGFSADLKTLVALAGDEPRASDGAVLAPWGEAPGLHRAVARLRAAGRRVLFALPGAESEDCEHELACDERGEWTVRRRRPASPGRQ